MYIYYEKYTVTKCDEITAFIDNEFIIFVVQHSCIIDYSCKTISLFRNWSTDEKSGFIAFRRDALEWKIFQ